ncbi:MAG: nitronate monooxygenase [Alphaproteobacteria bacterium]|nr:nitronate monooxygenase [Alphaproteobacteria bacterium]
MPKLMTPLCHRLGITLPIIQAPISASPEFVAAVSNRGGLGMIQATWLEIEELRDTISEVGGLTAKPFGVNFVLSLTEAQGHTSLDAALELGVPVVSTFWADPAPVIARIHDAGALSFHTVGSAEEARRVVDLGVDAVVAQGVEAGGHVWGQVGTMVLTPAVVDAVPETPVIAAGGIADGRGLAAILALGAQAAWVGTRLLLARECKSHPAYRERLLAARETDTVHTTLFDGGWPDAPLRCLSNKTLEAWIAAGRPDPGARPNEGEVVAYYKTGEPVLRYSINEPTAGMTGDVLALVLYAGQGVGLAKEEKPVAEILEEMAAEASQILARLAQD